MRGAAPSLARALRSRGPRQRRQRQRRRTPRPPRGPAARRRRARAPPAGRSPGPLVKGGGGGAAAAQPGRVRSCRRRRRGRVISPFGGVGWWGPPRSSSATWTAPSGEQELFFSFPWSWEFGWKSPVGRCLSTRVLGRAPPVRVWPWALTWPATGAVSQHVPILRGGLEQQPPSWRRVAAWLQIIAPFNLSLALLSVSPFCYSRDSVIQDNCLE